MAGRCPRARPAHRAATQAEADRLARLVSGSPAGSSGRPHISAEIATFARVPGTRLPAARRGHRGPHLLRHPAGLLAGVWNALALTDGKPDRVRYLPDPASVR